MNLQLEGKTALVTGSTAGIGLAIAATLAREGAAVIVNGRTQECVDNAVRRCGAAQGIAADLGTEAGARAVMERFPAVDILVNNLGIFEPKPFEQIPDDDWRRFFEVNVLSGVRLSRHYIGGMKERNWGRIVFISSESALQIPVEMIHYGMTKTAQLALSRGLAEATAGTAVTVNAVLPGPTASEGVAEFVSRLSAEKGVDQRQFEREFFENARPSSLLRRFTTPMEVAAVVAFVCSPLAAAINGAAVRGRRRRSIHCLEAPPRVAVRVGLKFHGAVLKRPRFRRAPRTGAGMDSYRARMWCRLGVCRIGVSPRPRFQAAPRRCPVFDESGLKG